MNPNNMSYSDDELERRIEELLADGGESYILGEDARIDAMMRVFQSEHPAMTQAQINGIEAGLGLMTTPEPQLSHAAFAGMEAALLAQFQLQSAPQPEMSKEALNRIETQLRLRNAPQVEMSESTFLRIEQELLQSMPSPIPYWMVMTLSASIMVIAWFGFNLVLSQFADDSFEVPSEYIENARPESIGDNPDDTPSYSSDTDWGVVSTDVETSDVDDEDNTDFTYESETIFEVIPTELPEVVVENLPDSPEIILPPRVVVEGIIDSIDGTTITVFGMPFDLGNGLETDYVVGDMVTIEGIVNPNDSDTYLILSIDIPDDRDINRPVLAIYSGGTSEDGSPAPTTIVNSASGSDGGTSSDVTSALETPSTVIASTGTDDRCEDNERDRDQGRGNNCQRNSGIGSGNQP